MAYASQTDLVNFGFPAAAFGTLTQAQIAAQLQGASDYADTFFRARYGAAALPLQAWDTAVTEAVVKIAAYRLLKVRGYSANSKADLQFKEGNDVAVKWLNDVQRQQAHPSVVLAAGATAQSQPMLISSSVVNIGNGARAPNRGW